MRWMVASDSINNAFQFTSIKGQLNVNYDSQGQYMHDKAKNNIEAQVGRRHIINVVI